VGLTDGFVLGLVLDGDADGRVEEGLFVGITEGPCDGLEVNGDCVGIVEGVEEGLRDGALDGDADGNEAVGDVVGDLVSWQNPVVISSCPTNMSFSGIWVSYRVQVLAESSYTYTEQAGSYLHSASH